MIIPREKFLSGKVIGLQYYGNTIRTVQENVYFLSDGTMVIRYYIGSDSAPFVQKPRIDRTVRSA